MRRSVLRVSGVLALATSMWTIWLKAITHGAASNSSGHAPLTQVADIPLPGPAVRFDYQSLDASHGRLYIAHMNADQLVVFDVKKRELVANLDGFANVHGVLAVADLDRVYASATAEHKIAVVDMQTLKIIAKPGPVKYPDGIAYAPGAKRVFVSDEHGDADAVIDATTNSLIATISLGGGAGNTVYDPRAKRILVGVHHRNEIVTIDPANLKITGRYPLPGIENPHGISLDSEDNLAFAAGEGNGKLALVDLATMKVLETEAVGDDPKVLETEAVGDDPDVLAFDPGLKRLYVSAESGDVRVFQLKERKLTALGGISMPHAHTVSVDPETHLVYFPLQNVDGHPLLRIMKPSHAQ